METFEIEKKQRAIFFNMLDSDRNGFLNFYEFFAMVRIFQIFDQFSEGDVAVPSEAYLITKEQIEFGMKTISTPNTFGFTLIKDEVEKLKEFKQYLGLKQMNFKEFLILLN
jgi:Ca2+-binding EF-hand superfamily protein